MRNSFFSLLVLASLALVVNAQSASNAAPSTIKCPHCGVGDVPAWCTDFDKALAIAKESQKPILIVFSGSDWCPPCIVFEKEILSTPEFLAAMKACKFVPLFVDFPRTKRLPADQTRKNAALAEKFNVEGFPTTVLLNPDGKVLAKQFGLTSFYGAPLWRTPKDFLAWIERNAK